MNHIKDFIYDALNKLDSEEELIKKLSIVNNEIIIKLITNEKFVIKIKKIN